jgi:hypothetical protein
MTEKPRYLEKKEIKSCTTHLGGDYVLTGFVFIFFFFEGTGRIKLPGRRNPEGDEI